MTHECMCGCGDTTNGRFSGQGGHDSIVRGWYTKAMELPTHEKVCDEGLRILASPEVLEYYEEAGFDMAPGVRRYLDGLRRLLAEYCAGPS